MKFGNASWGYREEPLEEQLASTKRLGLGILELGIANAPKDLPLTASDEELEAVKKLYEKYEIELCCAATGNDFSCGNKDDVEKIKKVTDICSKLGVKYLRIFAGFSPYEEVTGSRWETMKECLCEVDEYSREKGVYMVIETHGGVNGYDDGVEHFKSVTAEPETLYRLMSELPERIKLNFDPANLWAVGVTEPEKVYNKLKSRVAYVHLKDFAPLESGHIKPAACGESKMDWKAILKALKDFDGAALFEYEIPDDVEEGSKRCRDYLYGVMKEI